MDKINKLKRAVIKEEYIKLTNDAVKAIILDRFVTLTYEALTLDRLIQEEILRAQTIGISINMPLTHGWVYKKSDDLTNEIMISSLKTTRIKLNELVASGYIFEKNSDVYKLEKTRMYKANIAKLKNDIENLGYSYEALTNM